MIEDQEVWKPISGWPYEVSSWGRVRRLEFSKPFYEAGRLLATRCRRGKGGGYPSVWLHRRKPGESKSEVRAACVHTLVMEAFVGPRPFGMQVNHKDADKSNNRIENLEYCTPKENAQHAKRLGLLGGGGKKGPRPQIRGEKNPNSKYSRQQIIQCHALRHKGRSYRQIAAETGVTFHYVKKVLCGENWPHVKEVFDKIKDSGIS